MKIFIVLPTYDEAGNIEPIIKRILTLHPDFNIIVVDDNSPDGTGQIVERLAQENEQISIIHRKCKAGLGTAYIEGFNKALDLGADLIFEMDSDFSHDPIYLKDFLNSAANADLVIGSRYVNGVRVEGWRFRRLLISKLANMFVAYIMVRPVWDFTAGFRCFRREVLQKIDLNQVKSDGYGFQIEMTYRTFKHGFRVVEIPIVFKERLCGYSKISKKIAAEAFWITLRCHAPISQIIRHLSFLFRDYREFTGECYSIENENSEN